MYTYTLQYVHYFGGATEYAIPYHGMKKVYFENSNNKLMAGHKGVRKPKNCHRHSPVSCTPGSETWRCAGHRGVKLGGAQDTGE